MPRILEKRCRSTWITAAAGQIALICCLITSGFGQSESFGTLGPLGRLADWVNQVGKTTVLNAPAAKALGLGESEIPMRGLAFKPPGDDRVHIVLVGNKEGRADMVLTYTTLDQVGPMWLTSPSGLLLKTIYEDATGVRVVTDGKYNAAFEAQKAYFLSKIPGG